MTRALFPFFLDMPGACGRAVASVRYARLWAAGCALCLMAAVLMLVPSTASASPSSEYRKAYQAFESLSRDAKRGQYRSHWKQLEEAFMDTYKADPDGPVAVKALFYAARVNEELGRRSFLPSDFRTAADYYKRVATRFSRHSWADDALYRRAVVLHERLNDSAAAIDDVNTILTKYTKGDMYWKAKELHRVLKSGASPQQEDSGAAGRKQVSPPPSAAPSPKAVAPKTSASTMVSGSAPGGNALLRDIRFQSSNEYTRIVLDVDREVPFQYQILPEDKSKGLPPRLYVDLKSTSLASGLSQEISVADGILRRVRAGSPESGVSRVVLDFLSVQKYNVFSLDNPYRVVIDVTSPKDGSAGPSGVTATGSAQTRQEKPLSEAEKAKLAAKYKASPSSRQQLGDLMKQLGLTVKTIMIDAGHGGKDPGASANGILEKNYVLRVAKMVGERLQKKGYTVLYTRTDDTFIPLEERTAMANVRKADMFVSIHINAHRSAGVSGVETYYLDLANSKSAVRVAARENAVSEKRISDLQFILTDLMLNSKMKESKSLAELVQKNMVSLTRNAGYQVRDNGVRSAPFYVLMGAKMPAVLVELGYCTNTTEARRIKSEKYLQRVADGVVKGIETYTQELAKYAAM